jgi:DNA-binding transcriptional LysR family regulator
VDALVKVGRLRYVLADFEPPFMPIQIVYPNARLLSSNVRAFVDAAVAQLRSGDAKIPPQRLAKKSGSQRGPESTR